MYRIRPCSTSDRELINDLVIRQQYMLRHLDWRTPVEWLSHQPFLLLENATSPLASLACIPEPQSVAWVRFFCSIAEVNRDLAWELLFENTIRILNGSPTTIVAALGLDEWIVNVLKKSGFKYHQEIIMMERNCENSFSYKNQKDFGIRLAEREDLPRIAEIDKQSFDPLWQNTLDGLTKAFTQASYFTVISWNDLMIGYQLSTSNLDTAHLARLAVLPEWQRKGIGQMLLMNMFEHYNSLGFSKITVNTQNDNFASKRLYSKVGFMISEESVPVLVYSL